MKKVGIIGGGQLGKMMILDGKHQDIWFSILDPVRNCPAHSIADHHIVADFHNVEAIMELAQEVDVVTYEFEHISIVALEYLEKEGHMVYPSSKTLSHIQNKYEQKTWLRDHKIPVSDFLQINSYRELESAGDYLAFPLILKTAIGGYDGKGNAVIQSISDISSAYEALGAGSIPLMVEKYIAFKKEISVLACRSTNGDVCIFPVAENVHINSILDETTVPASITEDTYQEALDIARKCLDVFSAYGMLCIEFFVTEDGHVLVNELAPRPHNSGHYTIEGCYTSQYEQHIRAILGLPLGSTKLVGSMAMKNIIGDHDAKAELLGLEEAFLEPDVKVHIYGKNMVKKGRKMGHLTSVGTSIEEALENVRKAHKALKYK